MGQRRGHYVPAFLLRRFADPDRSRGTRVFRLDRHSGRTVRADPRTEAAEKHMYRIEDDNGQVTMEAEAALARIEAGTAPILTKLQDPGTELSPDERTVLGLFVAMQRVRTPFGRSWIKAVDEELAVAQARVDLLNDSTSRRDDLGMSSDDSERLLGDLDSGRLYVESPPSRQTALMFLAWEETAKVLVDQCEWTVLRAPEVSEYVISDNPVVHFDPTLERRDDDGLGFASSAYARTTIPIDPKFCIGIRPRGYPAWGDGETDAASVEEINVGTYAWAERAIYGRSQHVVTELRRVVKAAPSRLARYPRVQPAVRLVDRQRDAVLIERAQRRLATLPPSMLP